MTWAVQTPWWLPVWTVVREVYNNMDCNATLWSAYILSYAGIFTSKSYMILYTLYMQEQSCQNLISTGTLPCWNTHQNVVSDWKNSWSTRNSRSGFNDACSPVVPGPTVRLTDEALVSALLLGPLLWLVCKVQFAHMSPSCSAAHPLVQTAWQGLTLSCHNLQKDL